ncbi:GMC oxidoreductase [Marinobacteraceae bacterium S3BR75-40.1]
MQPTYDVVVIGSGFGGAITACRLAQAGRSVCILEKGQRWPREQFPRSPGELATTGLWRENHNGYPGRGFIEYRTFRRMDVVQGVGVGGGSLHYFNVHIQPPAFIFRTPVWPEAITLERLQPYYRVAAQMLGANAITPPENRHLPLRTVAFEDAVASTGKTAERVPICVRFGSQVTESVGGHLQSPCEYCGNCLLGCHVHAKNTLDLNYIALAEAEGAEVFPQRQVLGIRPLPHGYRVRFRDLRDSPDAPSLIVDAAQVVVAAGTLGSNELLLRCKYRDKTLPDLSRRLGHRFSGNGDFLYAGTRYPRRIVDPGRGPSITAGVGYREKNDDYIFIEDLGYPDPFIWYFNGVLPTRGRLRHAWQQLRRYAADSLGSQYAFEFDQLLDEGYLTHFLPYLGMATDASDGRLRLNRHGDIELDWSFRRSRPLFRKMIKRMQTLSQASGGEFVNSFLWASPKLGLPVGKTLTAHPLGGCAVSVSPRTGVTNDLGEVWGYPGLFVADGSLMPAALGVNPSATICAMAERVAFHMVNRRELQNEDELTPINTGLRRAS